MPTLKDPLLKAQTMMEYLLVMVVVAVIVFGAFKGGILAQTQKSANEYFNAGTAAIMGGYYDGNTYISMDPVSVKGGWCNWSSCVNGTQERECACPRPAFGGAACGPDNSGNSKAVQLCEMEDGPAQSCDPMKNFIWIPGIGCGCASGYYWSTADQACIFGTATVCEGTGVQLIDGHCKCPEGTYWNQGNLNADKTYGACVSDSTACAAPLVQVYNSDGTKGNCGCATGTRWVGTKCVPKCDKDHLTDCTCPPNDTIWDAMEQRCVLPESNCTSKGMHVINGDTDNPYCGCYDTEYYDNAQKKCVIDKPLVCDPAKNWSVSPDGKSCWCWDGYYWHVSQDKCVQDDFHDGMNCDSTKGEVVSDDGKACVCPKNQHWSSESDHCVPD